MSVSGSDPLHIGLCYDLASEYEALGYRGEEVAEFDRTETIDAIAGALERAGHRVDRVGSLPALVRRLALGHRWDLVFNLAEGVRGSARESQVPALLDAYGIAYTFSDPLTLTVALHKGLTKTVCQAHGVATAPFRLVRDLDDLPGADLGGPLFVKPVAEGTGKGITERSCVEGAAGLREACAELLARYRQPVLVEPRLTGREFTVGVLGTGAAARAIGVMEIVFRDPGPGVYSYQVKRDYQAHVTYRLADDAEARAAAATALRAWACLGGRDGGRIDLRSDARGCPQLLEVNPLAGLDPVHSDLVILARLAGTSYESLIVRIVESASQRIESLAPRAAG